jgi:PAS domain S-box-containing protein
MKKILLLLLIVLNIIMIFPITIGLYPSDPIVVDEENGFLNEIIKYIMDKNSVEYNIIIDSQSNLSEKLSNNEIDAVAPLGYTEERAEKYYFNHEPLFFEWAVVYIREGLNLNSVLDLANKKIGVMKTDIFYEGKDGIKDILEGFKINAEFIEFNDYNEILKNLNNGEIDVGVIPRFFGLSEEKKYSNIVKTTIIFKPISVHIMFRKNNNLKVIFDKFDSELKKIKEDKSSIYYILFEKYFGSYSKEEIPGWLKILILIILIIGIFIVSIFYANSKILKKMVDEKTKELNETLSDLEQNIKELNNSKNLIEKIVDLSPNPLFIKDLKQNIVFCNNSFARLFNKQKEDMINRNLLDIFNDINEQLKEKTIIKDFEIITQERKNISSRINLTINNKEYYFIDYRSSINISDEEIGLLTLWVDITENVKQQKELEKLNEKLFNMIDIIQKLGDSDIEIEKYFDELLNLAIKLSENAESGSLSIAEGDSWKYISAVGHDIDILKDLNLKKEYMIQTDEDLKIFKSDELEKYNIEKFKNEIDRDKFFKAIKPVKEVMIATVSIDNDKLLSFALDILKDSEKQFDENDKKIFQALINIAKNNLKLKLNIDQVKNAYLNFARKLAVIAEAHDDITGEHIYRGELAYFIATKLKLPKEKLVEIKEFSPLHDIGKIFIPLEILNKKSRLSDEEFEIMKKHTLYAKRLLGEDPYFDTALKIALYHHEKYNSGGYPFNIKGDEIPIEAQIVSLVDVYDALRSKRPYKDAFSHEKVIEIILNGDERTSPKDFNPLILKILKEYSIEIKTIYDAFSD